MRGEVYLSLPVQSIRNASLLPKWRPSQLCVFRYYFPRKWLTNIPNSASSALLLSQPRSLSLPSTCPPLLWLPTTVPCPLRLSVRADPLLAKRLDWHIQLAACFIAKSLVYVASDLPYASTQSHHHTRGDPQPPCALHHAEQRISVQCARRREELCADRCRQMDHF